ncbi:MAG: NIPSNAP family protein [Bacteroidota bacterium]
MKRRSFVKASLLSATVSSIIPLENKAAKTDLNKNSKQEFYELRVYTFKTAEQEKITEDYFVNAAIPAFNRLGSKSIGVFKELKPEGQTKLFVIIPFTSIEDFILANEKLLKDPVYMAAGADYLNATAAAPAYERIESSLLKAFEHMPEIIPPVKKSRIFELRRYESATEMTGKKKIEMFNDKGEIDIFKRTGFAPVFFGETIFGALRPNLTYMITFDDMAGHDAHWKMFGSDPEWKKISSVPEYADARIVSHISSTFLVPAECSQI